MHTGTWITQTNLTTIQTQRATTHPHDLHTRAPHASTAETAADSAAAGPEPTAPRGRLRRGRLRRGRPQRTRHSTGTGKKTPGGAGTHTGHTRDTHGCKKLVQTGTRITQTNLTTYSQPSIKPNDTPARPRDGRNRGRLNSRKNSRRPGVPGSRPLPGSLGATTSRDPAIKVCSTVEGTRRG